MENITQLLNEKKDLMTRISKALKQWDRTIEQAIIIFKENNLRFEEMKIIDQKIPKKTLKQFNEEHSKRWLHLISENQKMIQYIKREQAQIQNHLVQIDNKEKVVSSYMSLQNKSLFIEKDY